MLTTLLALICGSLLTLLTALALYQWVLAGAALTAPKRPRAAGTGARTRFVVLIPAYNEEAGIAATVVSVSRCDYPCSARRVVVVADRCSDTTAARARACGAVCLERNTGDAGKGPAIAWAIDHLTAQQIEFDAIVVVDADTVVDTGLLAAFDERLRAGDAVQQAYNYLSNPWDTPFTRIISVTSVLRNGLFYVGKERFGLPAMLTGCGMCFSRSIIDRHRWTAFSVGEDWEFSASLLLAGERIHFNDAARVRAAESRNFRQASRQRLRWASGRHGVAGTSAALLVSEGIRRREPGLVDAALTIVAPTYSAQATLALAALAGAWLAFGVGVLAWWAAGVIALLAAYFALGLVRTDAPMRAAAGIALIPAFLPWRMAIEVLGLLGYGRRRWVRTSRVLAVLLAASLGAARVSAQVIFSDDMESDTIVNDIIGAWDGPHDPTTMYLTDQISHSGHRALELKYVPGSPGASFMYHEFPGRDRVYVRWYQRWSNGFIWEPSATKMVILRPIAGYPEFYPEVLWANGQLAIQAQVTQEAGWDSENFYQNVGEPVVFGSDRWYCVEVLVQLNTPGAADGEVAAWIDGALKLRYTGREFRGVTPLDPGPSTAQIQAVGATGYYGGVTPVTQLQYSWQDDFVVSADPIGFQFLSDDFEDVVTGDDGQLAGWDGPARPSVMHVSAASAHSGGRALQLDYAAGSIGAGFMYRHVPPQQQVYLRWFQRWSPGFVFEPSGTALTGMTSSGSFPEFYPFASGSDGTFAIQAQVVAEQAWGTENFFANLGDPVRFVPDRWYCIEVFVKLNTPGASDGQLAAWIDGDQALSYDGRRFRGASPDDPAPSRASIDALLVAGSYGGPTLVPQPQSSWHDDYVAATERIGCQAYPPLAR